MAQQKKGTQSAIYNTNGEDRHLNGDSDDRFVNQQHNFEHISEVPQMADNLWTRLMKEYRHILQDVKQNEVLEIRKQLKNKEIVMCIVGRHNSGKSSLLNSLIANRCLPTNVTNETGVHVRIMHDENVHPGYCTNTCQGHCPRLVSGVGEEICGADAIWSVLESANKHHRQTGIQISKEYTLFAHAPILSQVPNGWHLVLVDTPGFGEANMENMTSLATMLLNTSSAYLYIVDVKCIGDNTDDANMKSLVKRDKRAFEDNRVVIAVTKYDDCRPSSSTRRGTRKKGHSLDLDKLYEKVSQQVQNATEVECPRGIIFPISAQWAEEAREFRGVPYDVGLRDEVMTSLSKAQDSPLQGQGETAQSVPSLTLASQLERSSGILQLEEGLQTVIRHCIKCWTSGLVAGYTYHLSAVQKRLECQLQDKKKELEGIQSALRKHEDYQALKRNFMDKAFVQPGETPQIKTDMAKKFDMQGAETMATGRIKELMDVFVASIKVNVMQVSLPFGETELSDEINKFLEEELQPKLNDYLKGIRLDEVMCVFNAGQEEIDRQDKQIEDAAIDFLPNGWVPTNAYEDLRKKRGHLIKNPVLLHDTREPTLGHLNVQESVKIPQWTSELDEMVTEFHELLNLKTKQFISEELKTSIIEMLYEQYAAARKNRAAAIVQTFDLSVKEEHERVQRLKDAAQQSVANLSKDIDEISSCLKHLEQLHCGVQ